MIKNLKFLGTAKFTFCCIRRFSNFCFLLLQFHFDPTNPLFACIVISSGPYTRGIVAFSQTQTNTHTNIHTHLHTHTHTHAHAHTQTLTHIKIHSHIHTHTHTYIRNLSLGLEKIVLHFNLVSF